MELIELYNSNTIEQDFHPRKLLRLLHDTSSFPIQKERISFERGDLITLESGQEESPYVYAVENGAGAVYIGKQIVDFVGNEDFIGLHHGQAAQNTKMYGKVLTGKMTAWRFLLSDVMAKIMSMQEGYLYHYNYMRMIYERYALKIISSNDSNQQKVQSMLQVLSGRFGTERTEQYMKLPKCFTREVMANYTGISHTTLSAVLTQLEKERIVIFKSRSILTLVE